MMHTILTTTVYLFAFIGFCSFLFIMRNVLISIFKKKQESANTLNPSKSDIFGIASFLKERKEKRDKKDRFKYIVCSHCGETLNKCRCPYGGMLIEILTGALNRV